MNRLGAFAERYATSRLTQDGYHIITNNYHSRYGEIDIIAVQDEVLVFAEVKARSPKSCYSPLEAVTPAKMRKITATALCYLEHNPSNLQPRFDVIELIIIDNDCPQVLSYNHIVGAFDAVY